MKIKRFVGGTIASNGYILYEENRNAIIIDPGYNPKKFTAFLREQNLHLTGIILTHHHGDHTGAIKGILSEIDTKVMMHTDDIDMYKDSIDVYLNDGEKLTLNDETLEIIHTPGHTRGGICILCSKSNVVFTGDTLFIDELGRTDLSDGDENVLMSTVNNIIDKWNPGLQVYPGHGEGSSLKKIKDTNKEYIMLTEKKDRYIFFS